MLRAAAAAFTVLALTGLAPRTSASGAVLPGRMLWVWERPEDVAFIDTRTTGVAVLARTMVLRGGALEARPRMQPARIPAGAVVVPVVRIESRRPWIEPDEALRAEMVRQIAALARPAARAVQVDFDAAVSERAFYRSLLVDLRSRLAPEVKLSITALASWCIDDDWISTLPVDEAVPMLFRLGAGRERVWRFLDRGKEFPACLCRGSAGVSTLEPAPPFRARRTLYLFPERAWTEASLAARLAELR